MPDVTHETDDNIVLVSGDIAFRVYKAILTEQSPVLRDLFASSQPALDTVQKFDVCPVVKLSDPPEDLYHSLQLLFPGAE